MAEGTTWTTYDANKMTSKEIYGKVLAELGETNDKIVGVTADLAKSTNIGNFGDRFPDRLFNVGIAEQNLFGVAAGLAKTGLIPFASTFAIFAMGENGTVQIENGEAVTTISVKKDYSPNTGDNSIHPKWFVAIGLTAIAIGFMTYKPKKKKRFR